MHHPLGSRGVLVTMLFLCMFAIGYRSPAFAAPARQRDFSFSFFQGWETGGNILHSFCPSRGPGSELAAGMGLGWTFYRWRDDLSLGLEGIFLLHGGDHAFEETGAVLFLRWLRFPWNHLLATTVGVGEGASYAFLTPSYEGTAGDGVARLMNLVVLEFTFAPPRQTEWAFVLRVHHRSRAWGVFAEKGESNFFTFGFKYRF